MDEPADVSTETYRTSNQAFELVKRAAANAADIEALKDEARSLNERLDELWRRIEASPPSDPGVNRAWSDARLELMHLLSDGEVPTSARHAAFLEATGGGEADPSPT
jgi:hypothetical protein